MPVVVLLGLVFGFGLLYLAFNKPGDIRGAGSSELTASEGIQAERSTLMDNLISQTRHFKGDPDAPVTILEYSDFQ